MNAPLILDIETVYTEAHKAAVIAEVCPNFVAPSNYKDEAKIEAHIAQQKADWLAGREQRIHDGALHWSTGRVFCIGYEIGGKMPATATTQAETDADEASILRDFWSNFPAEGAPLVTFNGTSFDLPFLVYRSLILGVTPTVNSTTIRAWYARYRVTPHCDVRGVLTNWDNRQPGTLGEFCRMFGIPHDEALGGKDIAGLYAAKNFDAITAHCRRDVASLVALYARLAPIIGSAV